MLVLAAVVVVPILLAIALAGSVDRTAHRPAPSGRNWNSDEETVLFP